MPAPILYCGDTHLRNAAAYLAGVLTAAGRAFDYVPSDQPLTERDLTPPRPLVVLSDYPTARVTPELQRRIVDLVAAGTGLLMIGGWESFHGAGGDWDGTPVGDVLPVEIEREDDRIHCDQPALLRRSHEHAIVAGLPWETRPPTVGGFNRFVAKRDADVLLEADRFAARRIEGRWELAVEESHPLLVVGRHGKGRTAALATDVAPHWVGGLVDWGTGRVAGQAPGADAIEVGSLYAQLLVQLIDWCAAGAA